MTADMLAMSLAALAVCLASSCRLDAGEITWARESLLGDSPPFSFVYDGKPSSELLPKWERSQAKGAAFDGAESRALAYADPTTGLRVACEARFFADFPAVEWVMRFTNSGAADTPIIDSIRPLDLRIEAPEPSNVRLHYSHGSTCTSTDFLPIDDVVEPGATMSIAPAGGRSSNGRLPFFNLQWGDGGLVGAIGWSGQWETDLKRDAGGMTLKAGQQTTRFRLHPGESVRTPRILLLSWRGEDYLQGNNLLRRLLIAHYLPRIKGEIVIPPIAHNTWFTFDSGNEVTEENQIESVRAMSRYGVEYFWLDAGWFEGGWPGGAGSWVPKKEAFPRGLKPLSDVAHKHGMKFIVWFEPERVTASSRIARDHPEWVLHAGTGDGLFNLGDPDARRWLTDHLSKCIADWGIDIYRNDFNIDPLPFWQAADAPDRQGITEIRYIEGLYAMWDELRARHPTIAIDNCASGGRRIDLETTTRSLPLTRSDTATAPGREIWDQVQSAGLSLWVPLHASLAWQFDPYGWRSVATAGTSICPDSRPNDFPVAQARKMIGETKSLRPFYLGDYYPLTAINLDPGHWIGWQYDRPDLGEGFAMLFRRDKSPYAAMDVALRGLDAESDYEVSFVDTGSKSTMTGVELACLRVKLDPAPSSCLIRYRRLGGR